MTGVYNILITGGGTGGHLYPALAIAEALQKKHECRLLFVGTAHRLEARVVPGLGYPFKSVWISGLHRRRILRNLLFPLKMA
ncbi:glycosyltransferase, partial [bacterium]|nr:glycosyltransferase [bacterium]